MATGEQHPYAEAADRCAQRFGDPPHVAVVLGSGAGVLEAHVTDPDRCPYSDLGLPPTGVSGHSGALVVGTLGGTRVALMSGRVHGYEGGTLERVVRGVRAMSACGVPKLLMTSAVGSLDPTLSPGDLVRTTDHINLMGVNPLVGPNIDALGDRFPDMSAAYDPELGQQVDAVAESLGIALSQGVYVGVRGPSFETAAEVRMLGGAGGTVVGMSVVPETIAAVHAGMKVVSISIVSNHGTGLCSVPTNHDAVTQVVGNAADRLAPLIKAVVGAW